MRMPDWSVAVTAIDCAAGSGASQAGSVVVHGGLTGLVCVHAVIDFAAFVHGCR